MKKILALMLILIAIFAFCSCGGNSNGDADKNDDSSSSIINSTENDTTNTNSSNEKKEETGYVGSWIHKKTADEPFEMKLTINADGTVKWFANQEYFWYEDEDEDAREGGIELAREDNMGYGDDAYLTEDGKLCIEKSTKIGDKSYEQIIFERN